MNGQMVGANLDALDSLRQSFEDTAIRVGSITARATEGATNLTALWNGPDAGEFNHRWMSVHRPTMLATVESLRAAAAMIETNADAQRMASEADLVGLPSGGVRGPGGAGGGPGGEAPNPLLATLGLPFQTQADPSSGAGSWTDQALNDAGIDLDQWRPELGADANREAIIDVYRYYGDLYLADPDLQWAGMANAIGPSFAAGFFDLAMFRQLAGDLESVSSQLPPGSIPLAPEAIEALAGITEEELRFYETTFLQMQYDIFLDQAPMHEAYVTDGIDAIRQMGEDRAIPPDMVAAWELLDEGKRTGDQSLIAEANTRFLQREQREIIDTYYHDMYNRFPSGPAFTYLMTMIGTPSIPGAGGYADVYPVDVSIETPGPHRIGTPDRLGPWSIPSIGVDNPLQGTITVETPFPDGNLADFDDRWKLIEENTLPIYLDLDPEVARDLAAADVSQRIDEARLGLDDVVEVASDWEIDVDQ